MGFTSPGFTGRRRSPDTKLPPGQYLTEDFPVLSAGPTPRVPLDRWQFAITTETGRTPRVDLGGAHRRCPRETPTVDIHCVTKWSKLDTSWQGVSLDVAVRGRRHRGRLRAGPLLRRLHHQPAAGGPARRQGLDRVRVRRRRRWTPEHGGPARLLVPHLYLWKSAKWVQRHRADCWRTSPGSGRPPATTTTVTRGASSGTRATDRPAPAGVADRDAGRGREETPTARTLVLRRARLARSPAGQHVDVRLTAPDGYSDPAQLLDRLGAGRRPGWS